MGQKRKPKKAELNFFLNGTCPAKAASVSVYSHQIGKLLKWHFFGIQNFRLTIRTFVFLLKIRSMHIP